MKIKVEFREFDRLTQQAFGTNSRQAVMPMDAYRKGDEFAVKEERGVDQDIVEMLAGDPLVVGDDQIARSESVQPELFDPGFYDGPQIRDEVGDGSDFADNDPPSAGQLDSLEAIYTDTNRGNGNVPA